MSDGGKFKAWWAGLSPGKRNVLGVAVLFGTLAGAGWLISPKESTTTAGSKSDLNSTNLVLPNRKNVTQEGLAAGLEATGNRVKSLEHDLGIPRSRTPRSSRSWRGAPQARKGSTRKWYARSRNCAATWKR